MKKTILFLCCLLTSLIAFGQEPLPPTQEWCEWAFQQIPDHKNLSKVDADAFSIDFRTLLKISYTINDWELEKDPGEMGYGEFPFYWYAGNGDSPLDDPKHTVQFKVGKVQDGKTTVDISIHTPSWLPYGPEYHRFMMCLVYENSAWRIDDWLKRLENGQNYISSMSKEMKSYIGWYWEQISK